MEEPRVVHGRPSESGTTIPSLSSDNGQPVSGGPVFTISQGSDQNPHLTDQNNQGAEARTSAMIDRPLSSATTTSEGDQGRPFAPRLWLSIKIRELLVKYWIWMVAFMLMVMSLGGQRVVIYRVVYMFFFLSFLLLFQLSYRLWRRILYTFWLCVIVYSMVVLTAIYTYQFKHFPDYWKTYLYIGPQLQRDIGLEKYDDDPWWLFKELFTPTFFIIITIVQLQFFHRDFMELSDYEVQEPVPSDETRLTSSAPTTVATERTPLKWSRPPRTHRPNLRSGSSLANVDDTQLNSSAASPEVRIEVDADEVAADEVVAVEALELDRPRVDRGSRRSSDPGSNSVTDVFVTSREPTQGEGSSSFATPLEADSPNTTTVAKSRTVQMRRKTISDKTVKIADIRQAAADIKRRASGLWDTAKPRFSVLYEVLWRFLEIHTIKVVFISVITVAVLDVSAVNFVYVVLSVVALPIGHFERLVTHLFAAWSALLILARMLYQLSIADYLAWNVNCTTIYGSDSNVTYAPFNETIDSREYIGFSKTDKIFSYIMEYLAILLILTLHALVRIRQRIHRHRFSETVPPLGVLFVNNSRRDADHGLLESLKFFLNYGFYKFGLEFTSSAMIILVGYRMDIMSVVFSLFLVLFSVLKRNVIRQMWPLFTGLITISIPLQYANSLGVPTALCVEYPWTDALPPELRDWLFLADFQISPNVHLIVYDFMVLLLASRQRIVFKAERLMFPQNSGGGSNAETCYDRVEHTKRSKKSEVPDFFTYSKTALDHLKSLFFSCFYWITLAVVFLTATGQKNLFGFGYLLGCFFFLWNGSEFYLKPIKTIMKTWNGILAYTAIVMLLKTSIEIVGCIESDSLYTDSWCWLAQLFGIACKCKIIRGPDQHSLIDNHTVDTSSCILSDDASGLFWDGICFCFLMVQKRIFGSHYFSYLVKDIKAQQVLASRGAELIHEIQAREVMEQEQAERDVMGKIKMKMDRIRANQQSQKGDKAKSHRQDFDYGYGDVSPFSTAEGESSFPHSPEADEEVPISHTLPTVYSPTPSLPTILSPSSAASHDGKGYLEVYRVPLKHIDAPCSSSPTVPSMSFASSPTGGEGSIPFFSPMPPYARTMMPSVLGSEGPLQLPTVEQVPSSTAIISRPSFRLHRKPSRPISRVPSVRRPRKLSAHSNAASHGSSVRSGDYYMFDDPESELIDLDEKPRKSLIPDPEGDELRRIANVMGISAFVSQLVKGNYPEAPEGEPTLFSGEPTDIGESSKDSAIVSVDRMGEVVDSDASVRTVLTSVPTTSTRGAGSSRQSVTVVPALPAAPQAAGRGDEITGEPSEDEEKEDNVQEEDVQEEAPSEAGSEITFWEKLINWFRIFCLFIESCVISATAKLNHVSRDYRYVSRRLAVEKRALKLLFEMEESEGVSYDTDWKKSTLEKISKASVPQLYHRVDSVGSFKFMCSDEKIAKKKMSLSDGEEDGKNGNSDEAGDFGGFTFLNSNAFVRFFRSLFYTVVSQSEVVCFAMVIINQIMNASLLSLPLPIMVFLWGCLSVPRPSKTFWISLITYTEAVVVAKYVFHFRVWPWLDYSAWAPRIIGIGGSEGDKSVTATHIDLVLLLFLFFHRFMLKSLGLWDLDISLERQKLKETVEEHMEDEAKRDSCLSIASSSKAADQALDRQRKQPAGLRKRKLKTQRIKAKEDRQVLTTAEIQEDNGEGIMEITENSDAVDRKESGVSAGTSSTSKAIDELSKDEDGDDKDAGDKKRQPQKFSLSAVPIRETIHTFVHPVSLFYQRLLHPPFRIARDYYAAMFLCDFVNFFIVVFGYNSFGSAGDAGITTYFEENRVPVPFLVMVMAQFCSIIIDRALYLRKNMKGRLVFHVMLVFIIHFWLFFTLPAVTERRFIDVMPPKYWYIFKSVYFLLSALQIKGGYPTRILGNNFTKKYSYINLYAFKGYIAVPFLYDMRLIMDWIWTDTSLELDEWSIMEDIFKNLFQRKCELQFQESFPELRGSPRRLIGKYLLGGAYLVLIIGAIWFPLVIFAVGGTVGSENRPVDVMVELEISGYVPIAKMSKTKVNTTYLTESQFNALPNVKKLNRKNAESFLSTYDYKDTTVVKLNGKSTPVWGISPPSQSALINDLLNDTSMDLKVTWFITRHKQSKTQNMDLTVYRSYDRPIDKQLAVQLVNVLNGTSNSSITLSNIFPNFIRVPEKGEPDRVRQLDYGDSGGYRSITLTLKKGQFEEGNSIVQWWEVSDICDDDPFSFIRSKDQCDSVMMVLFSDRIFSGALQFVSGYGILGLYTTFVFLMSRIIRGFFDDVSFKVIYTQMPNVDKVLQLCLDIYLVRESKEFSLEEDLFAKLLFLYRSPETLIKWTKQAEEQLQLPAGQQNDANQR